MEATLVLVTFVWVCCLSRLNCANKAEPAWLHAQSAGMIRVYIFCSLYQVTMWGVVAWLSAHRLGKT